MQNIEFMFGGGGGGGDDQGSLKCPRCGSLNTKFCYYNNYNLSQPRFFCKGCRRYWTKGGVLRNVPIGSGSRKTKRSKKKNGNGKTSSVSVASARQRKFTNSQNSTSDSSVAAANISPFTPAEPPMLTDNHRLFSEMGEFRSLMTSSSDDLPLGFISAPETSSLMQQRDEDQVAVEDWGLFDQSYWLNNTEHQLNYFV